MYNKNHYIFQEDGMNCVNQNLRIVSEHYYQIWRETTNIEIIEFMNKIVRSLGRIVKALSLELASPEFPTPGFR